jgi:uncharacterized repeat protein (TIGR04076 family)
VSEKRYIYEESEDIENIELTEEEIEIGATRLWELTDEERKAIIPNLTPMQKRFLRSMRKGGFENYRIIQEVVSVKNCPRQAKVGGKIVYNTMGEIRPDDCDAFPVTGYCTQAMMAMLSHSYLISDRVQAGLFPGPEGIDYVRCPHMAPAEGGIGSVVFKIYCIELDEADRVSNILELMDKKKT